MKLRCSRCKQMVDAEAGKCASCGYVFGSESLAAAAAPLRPLDIPSASAEYNLDGADIDIEEVPSSEEQLPPFSVEEATRERDVVDEVEHALHVTGITDAQHKMGQLVPEPIQNFNMTAAKMTPFEAYLLTLVDGMASVDDIVAASGLTLFEAITALASLGDKGAVLFGGTPPATPAMPSAGNASSDDAVGAEEPDSNVLSRLNLRQQAVGLPPHLDNDPDLLMDRADTALKKGEFQVAREYAKLALRVAPNSSRAKVLITALNDPAHAQARAKVLLGHANRLYHAGDLAAACKLFEGAIEEHEALAIAHHRLALATVKLCGDMLAAAEHGRRAAELAPENEIYQRNWKKLEKLLVSHGA